MKQNFKPNLVKVKFFFYNGEYSLQTQFENYRAVILLFFLYMFFINEQAATFKRSSDSGITYFKNFLGDTYRSRWALLEVEDEKNKDKKSSLSQKSRNPIKLDERKFFRTDFVGVIIRNLSKQIGCEDIINFLLKN